MDFRDYPQPFLSREEANERLKVLGFNFEEYVVDAQGNTLELLQMGQEKKFQAIIDIIAGAIAEWSDCRPEGDGFAQLNAELQEYAQEWLVG